MFLPGLQVSMSSKTVSFFLAVVLVLAGVNLLSFYLFPLSKIEKLRNKWLNSADPQIGFFFVDKLINQGDWYYSREQIRLFQKKFSKKIPKEKWQELEEKRRKIDPQNIKREILFWKKIASKDPYYPDSWAQLAINWVKLGDFKLARLAIAKAVRLDPVREEFKEVERKIKDLKRLKLSTRFGS